MCAGRGWQAEYGHDGMRRFGHMLATKFLAQSPPIGRKAAIRRLADFKGCAKEQDLRPDS